MVGNESNKIVFHAARKCRLDDRVGFPANREKGKYFMNIYDKKILLVDDNRELLVMTADTLRRNGYSSIVTAENVKEAVKCFEREEPEMAILDIMLPDGDGFTLFRKFRETSNIPILFLSAKDEDNDRLFGLGLGADDYITKPFLSQELVLRVGCDSEENLCQTGTDRKERGMFPAGKSSDFFCGRNGKDWKTGDSANGKGVDSLKETLREPGAHRYI